MGRHNEYWRWSRLPLGKKRWVLHNSGHVTRTASILALLVKGAGRYGGGRRGSYANLIGLNLAGLKAYERDELPAMDLVHAHYFSSFVFNVTFDGLFTQTLWGWSCWCLQRQSGLNGHVCRSYTLREFTRQSREFFRCWNLFKMSHFDARSVLNTRSFEFESLSQSVMIVMFRVYFSSFRKLVVLCPWSVKRVPLHLVQTKKWVASSGTKHLYKHTEHIQSFLLTSTCVRRCVVYIQYDSSAYFNNAFPFNIYALR